MRLFAGAILALSMAAAGCASLGGVTPKSPAQAVYQIEGNYAAALTVAVAYKNLPACAPDVTPICSDATVVAKVKAADATAWGSIQTAETLVRNGVSADSAIAAAAQAVTVLQGVTSSLKVK